jgi:hypothetical protein
LPGRRVLREFPAGFRAASPPRLCVCVEFRSGAKPLQQPRDLGCLQRQGRHHPPAGPPRLDHPGAFQRLQVARRARLGQPDGHREVADVALAAGQFEHDLEPRWLADGREKLLQALRSGVHCIDMHTTPRIAGQPGPAPPGAPWPRRTRRIAGGEREM